MPFAVDAEDLCFWHMPKCASTFVAKYLQAARGARCVGHGHDPVARAATLGLQGMHHCGLMRNPWDWYASWWRHARRPEPAGARTTLAACVPEPDAFRVVLRAVTRGSWPDPPLAVVDRGAVAQGDGPGLWSAAVRGMYRVADGWGVASLLDAATIRPALRIAFGWRLDPSEWPLHNTAMKTECRASPDGLTDYATWYDEEMTAWVAEADGALAATLGYDRPHGPAREPVLYLSSEVVR